MRFVVLKPDGRYVSKLIIPGCSPPTVYTISTVDVADAHNFGSMAAAEKWIRENGAGKAIALTDDGFWPVEED